VADIAYWVPKGPEECSLPPVMLAHLVGAFQEGMIDSWDQNWRGFGSIQEDDMGDDLDDSVFEFPAIGVVFLPLPKSGAFGYSVWDDSDEHATAQLLRAEGRRLERKSRRYRFAPDGRTGPAWELLTAVTNIPADFIVFDPDEAASVFQ
jgi:hypothetical protein